MRILFSATFAVLLLASCSDSSVDPLGEWMNWNYSAQFYVMRSLDIHGDSIAVMSAISAVFDTMDSLGVHAGEVRWNDRPLRSRNDAAMTRDRTLLGTAYYLDSTEDTLTIGFSGAPNLFSIAGSSRVAPFSVGLTSLSEPMQLVSPGAGTVLSRNGFNIRWIAGTDSRATVDVWIIASDSSGNVTIDNISTNSAAFRGIPDNGNLQLTPTMLASVRDGPVGIAISRNVEQEQRLADRRRIILTMSSSTLIRGTLSQ